MNNCQVYEWAASLGIKCVINAMVEDGFITQEAGQAFAQFYSINITQDDKGRAAGTVNFHITRKGLNIISDLPRATSLSEFDSRLLESMIDRVAKLEDKVLEKKYSAGVAPSAKTPST